MATDVGDPDYLLHFAGRISRYALRLPDFRTSGDDVLTEQIHDRIADLGDLLTVLAFEHYLQRQEAARFPHWDTQARRRGTAALTGAAQPVGHALADLGAVVERLGFLHETAEYAPTAEHTDAVRSARDVIRGRLASARSHLNAAARRLSEDAEQLLDPPGKNRHTHGVAPFHAPASTACLPPAPHPPSPSR
ncbi:hypothetical protein [Streptomyces sp. NPDC056244]|uniref:hypothetical protein n=1 Tax=Streptomyces sp. NPDC056244 TaxID=3345762 RepID=UPI0035D65D23